MPPRRLLPLPGEAPVKPLRGLLPFPGEAPAEQHSLSDTYVPSTPLRRLLPSPVVSPAKRPRLSDAGVPSAPSTHLPPSPVESPIQEPPLRDTQAPSVSLLPNAFSPRGTIIPDIRGPTPTRRPARKRRAGPRARPSVGGLRPAEVASTQAAAEPRQPRRWKPTDPQLVVQAVDELIAYRDEEDASRQRESDNRSWIQTTSKDFKVETVQSFYQDLHSRTELPISHCVVCNEMKPPSAITQEVWRYLFPTNGSLWDQVQPFRLLDCPTCFPPSEGATAAICNSCMGALRGGQVPPICRGNNLGIGCSHSNPPELQDLTPIEERLISISQSFGCIYKMEINKSRTTSGSYRKLRKGHITVFPNNLEDLTEDVLPHPIACMMERIGICFVGPTQPLPKDVAFMLAVRPAKVRSALEWLKEHNPLYSDIQINNTNLDEYSDDVLSCDIPRRFFDMSKQYNPSAEELIQTSHYTPAVERGETGPAGESNMEQIIDSLDACQNNPVDEDARTGGNPPLIDSFPDWDAMFDENDAEQYPYPQITSSGCLQVDSTTIASTAAQVENLQAAFLSQPGAEGEAGAPVRAQGSTLIAAHPNTDPFIVSRHGVEFEDSSHPEYFPKMFPTLFPFGEGGPRPTPKSISTHTGRQGTDISEEKFAFGLKKWAVHCLRRHGGFFAQHPVFPFLVFDIDSMSGNRRISHTRMSMASFDRLELIVAGLTTERLQAAEEELKNGGRVSDPDIHFLMSELRSYGQTHPMSNENRLASRNKIKSMCWKYGLPSFWFTINPNDLTNPCKLYLCMHRFYSAEMARAKLADLTRSVGFIHDMVRDPVSSAEFYYRLVRCFFEQYVRVGKPSIFGRISAYYALTETNERGALHIHGLMWLHGNKRLPDLVDEAMHPGEEQYRQQIARWVDDVFSEDIDLSLEGGLESSDSPWTDVWSLMSDKENLASQFEEQANRQAWRHQKHVCTFTCVKYSYQKNRANGEDEESRAKPTCRFRAPWALRAATGFNEDGDLKLKRSHPFINRWSKPMMVGLRHNHDLTFLNTTSQSLSMIYYVTNYATKLNSPMWKRLALSAQVTQRLADERDSRAGVADGDTSESLNLTRQFFMRWANKIYSDREMSAVEVCYYLLGYPTDFSSVSSWTFLYPGGIYHNVARRMRSHQARQAALLHPSGSTDFVTFTRSGKSIDRYQAYLDRGQLLRPLCFWEYSCLVDLRRKGDRFVTAEQVKVPFQDGSSLGEEWQQVLRRKDRLAVPVISGYFSPDLDEEDDEGNFQKNATLLLSMFIPWELFLSRPESPVYLWEELQLFVPDRIRSVIDSTGLLHRSREDARRDARMWRDRGDEQVEAFGFFEQAPEDDEFQNPDEMVPLTSRDWVDVFAHLVRSMTADVGCPVKNSAVLHELGKNITNSRLLSMLPSPVTTFADSAADIYGDLGDLAISEPAKTINATYNFQGSVNQKQQRVLEGEEVDIMSEALATPPTPGIEPAPPTGESSPALRPGISLEYGSETSFTAVGKQVADDLSLNKRQLIAFSMVMEALDRFTSNPDESQQYLGYLGGEGGTGKSRVILAYHTVFERRRDLSSIVLTATSGSAAAQIGGSTYHSALGINPLTGGARTGRKTAPRDAAGPEVYKWKTKKMLVLDEVSMLGCKDLCAINKTLQHLRPSSDGTPSSEPFGGIPVVIFAGDFMQFPPVNQQSILIRRDITKPRLSVNKQIEEDQARELFAKFRNVIMLKEQVRASEDPPFQDFLRRLRNGQHTRNDGITLNRLATDPSKLEITHDLRIITPRNQDRWNITLASVLQWGASTGSVVTIFLSTHAWSGVQSNVDLASKACAKGDVSGCPVPAIFPYVKGMPVCLNENKFVALKVANGSLFEAVGIIPDPKATVFTYSGNIRIHVGKPLGIILKSSATAAFSFPNIPPGTILILPQKTDFTIEGIHYQRWGLPCTPGFCLTDYKSQSKSLSNVALGLYSNQGSHRIGSFVSLYVQLSRAKSFQSIRLLKHIVVDDFVSVKPSLEMKEAIQKLEFLSDQTIQRWRCKQQGR